MASDTLQYKKKSTWGGYFTTVSSIIGSPLNFFQTLPRENSLKRPLIFLLISSIFYSVVSISYLYDNSSIIGIIFLANALFMPFLAAVFSFSVAAILPLVEKPSFSSIFSVYAYASGVVMLLSWVPSLSWIFELIRGVLVTIGLVKHCCLHIISAITVVVLTIALLLLFFWTLLPIVLPTAGGV